MLWSLPRPKARKPQSVRRQPMVEALEDRCLPSVDVVLEWNAIALDAMKNDSLLGANQKQVGPTHGSRALAIVQAAVFDAVNSIDQSYTPYLINLHAPSGSSITAAAAQAAHDTLVALYPDFKPTLDADLTADLQTVSSPLSRFEGVLVGKIVAKLILFVRSNDGSNVPMPYTPGTLPGQWQPDPLHPNQKALGSLWGSVTPFALRSAEQFHVPPPPALTSQEYADAYNEVMSLGGDGVTTPITRTAEQTQIGIFWGYDGSPGLSTPPRFYNQIAETLAVQEHNSVIQNARFFALIDIAMADAGIACWDAKYDYNFWRPVTAIRAGDTDGNPDTIADPNWTPLGAPADNGGGTNFTPPFPAYASGHATFGGALFRMMADFFGRDDISFTLSSDEFNGITRDQNGVVRPVVTRSFDSFSQAAEENGQSRIYLGIHWSFDKIQGIKQGTEIADYIFAHFLRSKFGGGSPRNAPLSLTISGSGDQGGSFDRTLASALIGTRPGPALGTLLVTPQQGLNAPQIVQRNAIPLPVNSTVKVTTNGLSPIGSTVPAHDLDVLQRSQDLLQAFDKTV
jgi:hypothetical protein